MFFNKIHGQSIIDRTEDSNHNIIITTTTDTVAIGDKPCQIRCRIYNIDSVNYYEIVYFIKAPQSVFITSKDKLKVRFADGEVIGAQILNDGDFYNEGNIMKVLTYASDELIKKMIDGNKVESVQLVDNNFKHTIEVSPSYENVFYNMAMILMNTDVHQQIQEEVKWSELTKQPL
jgi:hypothetical protein